MIRIYTAAKFKQRLEIKKWTEELWLAGFVITSSWLNETIRPTHITHHDFWKKMAIKDLCEISEADILILDTTMPTETGGKEVEFGYALGRFQNKMQIIIGPYMNVFHTLCDKHFETWPECIEWLKSEYKELRKEIETE